MANDLDWAFEPRAGWPRIGVIDMHTGGEPLRVITSGLPPIEGRDVLEKRRNFRDRHDALRKALMWEPRGHADMYGAIVTPSAHADFDVFFLHNEGYSTMCGHAIIALTKLVIEAGLVDRAREEIVFSVPAGLIRARAHREHGEIVRTSFLGVPSFLLLERRSVDVPGLGPVAFDVAYGGAFYAFVEAAGLGLRLEPAEYPRLIDAGRRIKRAVMERFPIRHPFEDELGFLYGTIFTGAPRDPRNHSRNVCIFADGEVDRSATGSGVSARAALHHARGELAVGEQVTIESLVDSTMTVEVAEVTTFGPHAAVIPRVGGSAFVTGRQELYLDPRDALGAGFFLR